MIETVTASSPNHLNFPSQWFKRMVISLARRFLSWEPRGSLLIELPDGEQWRFGKASEAGEPLLKLNNYRVIATALRRGSIGFAESYMSGDIDCSDLLALFQFYVRNRDSFVQAASWFFDVRANDRIGHFRRRNSKRGAQKNIQEHYDLGNDFYRLWLDAGMNYSSGLYESGVKTLEQAQQNKIDFILNMMELAGGEHVLEIGCGWGGLACTAAKKHASQMLGVTLSEAQLAEAKRLSKTNGLSEKCTFRLEDYRDVTGRYDRIVSVEMIEAVGEENWPDYFEALRNLLQPDGVAVIQAITIDENYFSSYRKTPDFIQRYIFPGGMLPTPSIIAEQASAVGLHLDKTHHFGFCYAKTLHEWRRRFETAWSEINRLGFDPTFKRKWLYYLTYCEAGFQTKMLDVGVYQLRKA